MRHALAFGALAALSLTSISARAQAAPPPGGDAAQAAPGGDAAGTARQRYNAGSVAFQARRFVEAALDFEAAAVAMSSPVALFTAALAWEQANVPDRAADDYGRCVAMQGLPPDKAQQAKDRLSALEAVLGRADVTAPDGWRVQLDGNSEVPTPATLHGTAGVHSIAVRAPGLPIDHKPVTLELGKSTKVELTAPASDAKPPAKPPEPAPPPPPAAAPPAESSWTTTRHAIGLVGMGFGGAGLLAGIVLGLEGKSARDAFNAAPTQQGYDHASSLQTWTNVALIGGAVVAVGGALLEFWPASRAPEAAPPKPPQDGEPPAESKRAAPLLAISPTLGGAVVWGAF